MNYSDLEYEIFSKQFILQNFNEDNIFKLENTKIAVIGLGGIGCPLTQYLVSSGFKNLVFFDGDKVEKSNLGRQILYGLSDVEKFKVNVIECLGSLELPYLINAVCKSHKPDGIVALGCIIEGETTHYDVISNAIFDKLIQISVDHNIPITSAVLTVKNQEQAIERANGGPKDRATEAALSLASLIKLRRKF